MQADSTKTTSAYDEAGKVFIKPKEVKSGTRVAKTTLKRIK